MGTIAEPIHTRTNPLIVILIMLAGAGLALLMLLDPRLLDRVRPVLLGLVVLHVGLFMWIMNRYLVRKPTDLFHPLVYMSVSSILPMAIIKGLDLGLGGSSIASRLTSSPEYYLNLAFFAAWLGMLGITLGYHLPVGGRIARRLSTLPTFKPSATSSLGILVLFAIGLAASIELLNVGSFGSSLGQSIGNQTITSVLIPLANLRLMAFFLVAYGFARGYRNVLWIVLASVFLAILVLTALISGGRSQLLAMILLGLAGWGYAKYPDLRLGQIVRLAPILFLALAVGVLIASQYRIVRSAYAGNDFVSPSEIVTLFTDTIAEVSQSDVSDNSAFVSERLAERFSALENLSVTMARARSLSEAEKQAGIDNNIIKELLFALVPRPIWPDKPVVSDFGLWFTRLYLDSTARSWNGPTIFGDLYRNFDWIGLILGSIVLGVYLRIIYSRLIVLSPGNGLAAMVYYFLLLAVGFEGEYASFFTNGLRYLFVSLIIGGGLWLFGGLQSRNGAVLIKG